MSVVKIENEGTVQIVSMNRPEALNAFNAEMNDDLADALLQAAEDDSVRVLVLTGSGRAFSAGADLSNSTPGYQQRHGFPGFLEAVIEFPKPFLVAINGLGVGIGATICGLADIAYMAKSARLRCPFSSLGVTAEASSTYQFPRLMGHQRAFWFLLASEWMAAEQCKEAGLVMEVFDDEDFLPQVKRRARVLAAMPLVSLIATKKLLMDPLKEPMRESIAAENKRLGELFQGDAHLEARRAFQEKRAPDFTGH